jgi:hypothetical protein
MSTGRTSPPWCATRGANPQVVRATSGIAVSMSYAFPSALPRLMGRSRVEERMKGEAWRLSESTRDRPAAKALLTRLA